jgi:hypothetical protein
MTSKTPTNPDIYPPSVLTVVVNDRMLGNEFLIAAAGRDRATSTGPGGGALVAMRRRDASAAPVPATASRRSPRRWSPRLAFHLHPAHHH